MSDVSIRVAQLKKEIEDFTPGLKQVQGMLRACREELREIQDKCYQSGGHAWGAPKLDTDAGEEMWTRTCKECDFTDATEQYTAVNIKVPKWD